MAIPKTLKAIGRKSINIELEDGNKTPLTVSAKVGQVYELHNSFDTIKASTPEEGNKIKADMIKDFVVKVIKQGNEDDENIDESITMLFDAHYNQVMLRVAQAYGFLPKDKDKAESMIEKAKN